MSDPESDVEMATEDHPKGMARGMAQARYYLGRMTYSVGAYCELLCAQWDTMPEATRRVIRNSDCRSARLAELDWRNWWTDADGFDTGLYLHVRRIDGNTIHRVFCRLGPKRRLAMIGGELYWLLDAPLTRESE